MTILPDCLIPIAMYTQFGPCYVIYHRDCTFSYVPLWPQALISLSRDIKRVLATTIRASVSRSIDLFDLHGLTTTKKKGAPELQILRPLYPTAQYPDHRGQLETPAASWDEQLVWPHNKITGSKCEDKHAWPFIYLWFDIALSSSLQAKIKICDRHISLPWKRPSILVVQEATNHGRQSLPYWWGRHTQVLWKQSEVILQSSKSYIKTENNKSLKPSLSFAVQFHSALHRLLMMLKRFKSSNLCSFQLGERRGRHWGVKLWMRHYLPIPCHLQHFQTWKTG